MQFFSYSRDENGALQYTYGHERIPDNWYRRANDNPWTLTDIVVSTAQQCESYPSNCKVGGNTGEVNSVRTLKARSHRCSCLKHADLLLQFDGFDLGDITGGFINAAEDLQDPQRMGCFIAQAIRADTPSFLDKVFSGAALTNVLGAVGAKLEPVLAMLGDCPNLPAGKSVFGNSQKYPGANAASSGNRNPYK